MVTGRGCEGRRERAPAGLPGPVGRGEPVRALPLRVYVHQVHGGALVGLLLDVEHDGAAALLLGLGELFAVLRHVAHLMAVDLEDHHAREELAGRGAVAVHALNHLRFMKGIGPTLDNLKVALEGEVYEHTKMYPEFIQMADSENRKDARLTFNYANEAEKEHARLYQEAIEAVRSGKDLLQVDYFVCQTCGFTVKNEAPDKRPVCGSLKNQFKKIT